MSGLSSCRRDSVESGGGGWRGRLLAVAATSAIGGAMASQAVALPQGGTVVAGGATITYGESQVTIAQSSSHVIIEWQSFDTAAGERVHFDQRAFMAALNRVLSGEATRFDGALTGAGHLTIVNQAGIAFGPAATVDVGAITATTLDILNQNFLADRLVFDQYDDAFPAASVTNAGRITVADRGLAALVGPGVANSGLIQARTGAVVLASGTAATVDLYGDGLINFAVTGQTRSTPVDADGKPLPALVGNSGEIYADGGTVILTAEAAAGIVDTAINMSGVVQARAIEGRGGQIALVAGDDAGSVQVAGRLDAGGVDDTGGTVHILGDAVALKAGADIDVSGDAAGGEALIGGPFQGGALDPAVAIASLDAGRYGRASRLAYVDAGAAVNASAAGAGDGGTVVLWSSQATGFQGAIAAHGADGGAGGLVEISGGSLALGGTAAVGPGGRLLLDPVTLIIDAAAAGTIVAALAAGGAVDVQAEQSITVDAAIDSSAQASVATLSLRDEGGAAGLQVALNAPIVLGANQQLAGEATEVAVATTGSIQNGIDVAADGAAISLADGTHALGETGIVIDRPVILTGGGGTILQGEGTGTGIDIVDAGVNVTGLAIADFAVGIRVGAGDGFISFNRLTGVQHGIVTDTAGFTRIWANEIAATGHGILAMSGGQDVRGNDITARLDGIHFADLGGIGATIRNNRIEGGDDGIDFAAADNFGPSVSIYDNFIIRGLGLSGDGTDASGDGIVFHGSISEAAIELHPNELIAGADRGLAFEGGIVNSRVTIADTLGFGGPLVDAGIIGGTDGIVFAGPVGGRNFIDVLGNQVEAGRHGILFADTVSGVVTIGGNTIDAGNGAGGNGDGVHFASDLLAAQLVIGGDAANSITVGTGGGASSTRHDGVFFGGATLGATNLTVSANTITILAGGGSSQVSFGDMGVRFDGRVDVGTEGFVHIWDNTIVGGVGREDRGIAFWNGIAGDSVVSIVNNVISAGDDGIGIFDLEAFGLGDGVGRNLALRDDAIMLITGNQVGTSGTPVGLASTGDGNGIDFHGIGGSVDLVVGPNSISAQDNGIEFDKAVATTGLVQLSGLDIMSADEGGVLFAAGISGALVIIEQSTISAAGDGLGLRGTLRNAQISVGGDSAAFSNRIVAGQDGIRVGAISGGTFTVASNQTITGGSHGILFGATIRAATVVVDRNGAASQDAVPYDGTTPLDLDTLTATDAISGSTGGGIGFGTFAGASSVTVSRNVIADSLDGVRFADIGASAAVAVHNNLILGNAADAVAFAGTVAGAVDVLQNILADNGGDGVDIAPTADVGTGSLRVRLNFMPGAGLDHGNGGLGFDHQGAGSADIEYNWWGATLADRIALAIGGAPVPTAVLYSGIDSNTVPAAALADTPFAPFSFQQSVFGPALGPKP